MARINLSNGSKSCWFTADEASEALKYAEENGITFDAIATVMVDEDREAVAADFAPCTDAEFLAAYLRLASEDIVIG